MLGLPGGQGALAGARHLIQPPPRPSVGGSDVWVFPVAGEQARLLEVGFGVAIPLTEGANFDTVGGGAILAAAGLLVLGGIAVRRQRSRITGDIMIAVGAVPMLPWLWMILPPLAGIIVILAAAFDMAEARSLGERGTSLAARERLVLTGVVLLGAALVVTLLVAGPLIVVPILLGLVVYVGLRQRRRPA